MIKNLKFTTVLVTTLVVGIFYGIAIHKYEIFPYEYIKLTFNKLNPETQEPKKTYGPWSIGIYEGTSPFDLADPEDISNPVLTGKDVDDIDATFVADPFILLKDEEYMMFFDVLNRETDNGDIGYAVSKDGEQWDYKSIIIDEDFHLS